MRTRPGVLALVGVLLSALLLADCGDETAGGEADDEPRGEIPFDLVEMISESAVGGMVAPGAIALSDASAVQQFSTQFEDDRMSTRLAQVVADLEVPEDKAAYAAVVGSGCGVPTDGTVTSTDTGIVIVGVKPTTKPVECFAAVTSVAIVLVDESVVG